MVAVILFAIVTTRPTTHAQAVVTVPLKPNSDPDCASRGDDRIDCFVRGSDGALWQASETSGIWSAWESLGNPSAGPLSTGPSAVGLPSSQYSGLYAFVGEPDGALWFVHWTNGVGAWKSLGGTITSDPDCMLSTLVSGVNVDCYAIGTDNAVWNYVARGGQWISWGGVFGPGHGPSAVWLPTNVKYVFVRGNDGAMYWNSWDSTSQPKPSGWVSLGGTLTSDPDCASWGANRIDCVVRGTDNAVYWTFWDGTAWNDWQGLGGQWSSGPSVVSRGINSLDVFALGMDDVLYQNTFSGSGWSGWQAVPMTTGQVVTVPYLSATLVSATTSSTSSSSSIPTVTDWVLSSVSVNPPNPQTGEEVTFSATLALLSSTVSPPLTVYVQCQLDGQPCGGGSVNYPGPIGQQITVHTDTPWTATPGNHTVTWSVNSTGDPTPADNVMSVTFTVSPQSSSQAVSMASSSMASTLTSGSNLQVTVIETQSVTQSSSASTSQQAVTSPSLMDTLQQNSLPLIGALVILVIVLAVAMMRHRKSPPIPPNH